MTVITSQILDISNSSTVTFRQWANNTNKIVSDVTNVNNALTPIVANVNTLKTTTTRLSANVVTLNSQVATINSSIASPNIVAVSSLAANGIIVKTSANSMVTRTIIGPSVGVTVSNGDGIAGNPTINLVGDLAAIEALAATGLAVRTAADTWAQRSIAVPAAGITISNAAGIAGNPTLALANDLAALEAMSTTGFPVRTGTDTWSQRTIQAPSTGVTISNGDGVAGNPTISLVNDLSAIEALASTGFAVRISTDTWAQRSISVTAPLGVTNGDGVSGNPALTVSAASNTATGVIQVATRAETIALTADNRAITPLQLSKSIGVTLQGYDATTLKSAAIGVSVQGYDTNTLKSNATKTLTAGFPTTAVNDGTKSTGTYTPDPTGGAFREVTNNGAHTLAPPTTTGSLTMIVEYTNGATAGAITTSGWTKVTGDTFTTTNTNKFKCYISKGGTGTHLHIQAMQ